MNSGLLGNLEGKAFGDLDSLVPGGFIEGKQLIDPATARAGPSEPHSRGANLRSNYKSERGTLRIRLLHA